MPATKRCRGKRKGDDTPPPDRYKWPKGKPLPTHHIKASREPTPCPKCLRIRFDNLGQAVVCTSSGRDVAWFRCKACGHPWPLPVKQV